MQRVEGRWVWGRCTLLGIPVAALGPPQPSLVPLCRDPALTIPLKKVNAAVRSRTRTSPMSWGRWYRRLRCSSATWEKENAVFSALHPVVRPREGNKADGPRCSSLQSPCPSSGSQLTFSGLRHGRALGCWNSLVPAQMGMRM